MSAEERRAAQDAESQRRLANLSGATAIGSDDLYKDAGSSIVGSLIGMG